MKIWLIPLLLSLLLAGCAPSAPGEDTAGGPAQPVLQPISEPEPPPEPTVSHLMVAGDVMCHMPISRDAYVRETGRYDYSHILAEVGEQLENADYAVANLETVLGGGPKYSGFPQFNSPDDLAASVKGAGFHLLSTANNHAKDQGLRGVTRTLDVLDEVGLAHVGTHRSQEELEEHSGIYVADVGGISVAFLSYTYGLNGMRLDPDTMYAINLFNLDYATTLKNPDYERLKGDLEAARALDTDLIAVMIHWGVEYQTKQNADQSKLADFLVAQGADLVLGGHSHVLQPYETIKTTGWDGEERQGFVCYSLGNLLSNQLELETKTTAVLDLELTRDNATGETQVTDVRYTPYYMLHENHRPAGQRRHLLNIHTAMAEYEAGDHTRISPKTYQQLQAALRHCHSILPQADDRPGEAKMAA